MCLNGVMVLTYRLFDFIVLVLLVNVVRFVCAVWLLLYLVWLAVARRWVVLVVFVFVGVVFGVL